MRRLLFALLLLGGCSKGPQADLPVVGEARSLAAEWALVNEQAAAGQLTATYVRTMRRELRQQLQTSASSLTEPNSAYAKEIGAILAQSDDASPNQLRAHAARLKQIEDSLESA